ncbi:MAG: hypothetical protein ACR2MK_02540 [Solirubrobacteraceae bacterium]
MDGGWLARLRWRCRGAWLWPTFILVTIADGVVLHALPMTGETQTLAGGIVFGLVFNVVAVLLLSRPLGALLRRRRTDMPVGVARNYGGTAAVGLVTLAMLGVGLLHRPALMAQRRALRDAVVRAEAYIGNRAPSAFRQMAAHPDTYTIQSGEIYRTCVPNRSRTRAYCVIVKTNLPLAQSVVFDGYEPNSVFAEGIN